MQIRTTLSAAALMACAITASAQLPSRPDPKEIPLPEIHTSMNPMPGPDALPNRPEMPDPMILDNGQRVRTPAQWQQRRKEIRTTLEYYVVGLAPPPPGNVVGHVLSEQTLVNGKVKYRLVHLTFGPKDSLSLDIGIFTPIGVPAPPAIISPSGTPPGATPLSRLPQGANQGKGQDALLVTGPMVTEPGTLPPGAREGIRTRTAEEIATTNPALAHGYAFVTFNNNDCGEDTTLRLPDGSWAYRTTRFFPAYPKNDWGLLGAWAWGVSRIVDYLQTDANVDKTKLIVTGISRTGKSALIAGAFDDRIAMTAPVASSGGGTPAFRFSGEGRDRPQIPQLVLAAPAPVLGAAGQIALRRTLVLRPLRTAPDYLARRHARPECAYQRRLPERTRRQAGLLVPARRRQNRCQLRGPSTRHGAGRLGRHARLRRQVSARQAGRSRLLHLPARPALDV